MSRKLQKFFEKKRAVLWSVKNESEPRRESGITGTLNLPTGWAILTVKTSDPKLLEEVNQFIRKLEELHDPTL